MVQENWVDGLYQVSSMFLSFRIIFIHIYMYIYSEEGFFLIFGWDSSKYYLYDTLSYYNGT